MVKAAHPETKCKFLIKIEDGKEVEKVQRHMCGAPCGDCGAKKGEYHWDGCDQEYCPKCGEQLLMCECNWTNFGK